MPKSSIYLDFAAASPLAPEVLNAMTPYFSEIFYNPSATYTPGLKVKKALRDARGQIAGSLGAKSSEVIFTAGGTEANNLAIKGIAQKFPGLHIVSTSIEHDSVLKPLEQLSETNCKVSLVPPKQDGIIDAERLASRITEKTVLVSVIYANNEIGTIQPIKKISRKIDEIRKQRQKEGSALPIYLHTDACQATNYLDMHVNRLGLDLMSINAGKIYGPKQCGALFVKSGVELEPQIAGGDQERGLRSGTENISAIVGFAAAIKLNDKIKKVESERLRQLQVKFARGLTKNNQKITINGNMKHRLPNNLHLTFEGIDNEELLIKLDNLGIYASAGSACSARKVSASHVLTAIGLGEALAKNSIRISLGRTTSEADVDRSVKAILSLVK